MNIFKRIKKQCYKVTFKWDIDKSECETFVNAGCLEEAEDKAKGAFKEMCDINDLSIVQEKSHIVKGGIEWDK